VRNLAGTPIGRLARSRDPRSTAPFSSILRPVAPVGVVAKKGCPRRGRHSLEETWLAKGSAPSPTFSASMSVVFALAGHFSPYNIVGAVQSAVTTRSAQT